ncbi:MULTISPECIES: acetyl-CoA hydrolase/transferase family protein [unclassified Pseudofrankia]|uniref:acetyl-CoA hydrolase/transferase family protein n=1 Tax=unclassified Pseudofrankia TaxID=2994372 RepID=UPI0008DAE4E9|nr:MULTISPECIES: acetyl-CoA hydrolase/transferase C-terminal domain-containing protein [unclassified Pseudofrankia]MDT3439871.1 acetyl-CoA hydrolase/transferase C-terminal domain-containing protein [Pseudofrankia sp. BMG5.37]OHV48348.1 acetyl-CoA hydrolase [Pseudofrankia sp. BMG5.36]
MKVISAAGDLDLSQVLRPGDRIVMGQACGEPTSLVEALIEQGRGIDGLSAFIATSFSGLFTPAATNSFSLSSMGAIGVLRSLTKAHRLSVIPCHVSQVGPMIETGLIGCEVAFVQVSPADANGHHSLGLISDYVRAAVANARVVVAEVNDQVPFTHGEHVSASEIDYAVPVSRPPVEVPAAKIGEIDEAIAKHAATYIEDGSVIQTGVGAVPDAILRQLHDRTDLGVHSGMLGDGLIELVEAGVVTNARKRIDTGVSINGALIGTRRLYEFADHNPRIRMCATSYTHDAGVLAQLDRLVTINSAMEVDLTGQVNAEQNGSAYLGGTGGQVDFVRAGARSPGGHAIIALPATAKNGTVSRITARLSGPVTTARSDVDVIVTEFGAAELRGQTLAERTRRLIAVAHPSFQEELAREADTIQRRGF